METIRNDFFVTIKSASFDKSSSRKEYNVEIEVSLRDSLGRPVCFQTEQFQNVLK